MRSETHLSELLTERQIVTQLRARDRWEAISELVGNLVETGKIRPEQRSTILAAVKKRETSMSTGLGGGVAIPHATSDRIPRVIAALGRSQQRLDFGALDGRPASLVILLLVPQGQLLAHLRALANMAKLLQDAELRQAIEEAPDAREILRILRDRRPCCPC